MCSKLSFSLSFIFTLFLQQVHATELRVLQINIWQEGTVVKGGFDAIVEEILASKADIVTFSEVRNYKNTKFNERMVAALKLRGSAFYSSLSYDSGILSRYPIEDFTPIMPEKSDHGSVYKAVVRVKSIRIAVYTVHMDYLNASNYPPRGYDANTWEKLDKRSSSVQELLTINQRSNRDEATDLIIADAKKEITKGNLVIIGGDFNEPSHRDWTNKTRHLFDHNNLVVPWPTSTTLEAAGFKDAYREKYPDPTKYPGFTFPAFNPDVPLNKLIWAAEADERDRIDFIFYYPDRAIILRNVWVLGPDESIRKGQRHKERSLDPFILPKGTWPTDHKAVLALFNVN